MYRIDLREYKNKLRESAKEYRHSLSSEDKLILDNGILKNVLKLREYKSCDILYIYVSTEIEVDTKNIINSALKEGKKVAVPRCIPNTRKMMFHYIENFSQLEVGSFNVLEPPETLPEAKEYKNSLMIVPAMIIDKFGFRLGYGKGYYDRYIADYSGITAGICYSNNVKYKIKHGKYDKKLDYIITENLIKKSLT